MARRQFATLPSAPMAAGTVVVRTVAGAIADISATSGGSAIAGGTRTVTEHAIPGFYGPPDGTADLLVTMKGHGVDWTVPVHASDAPAAPSGGSVAGGVTIHKAPFAYNTAGLAAGIVAPFTDGYVPAVGDLLLDVWVKVITAWDGTTPLFDCGNDDVSDGNLFGSNGLGTPLDMTKADGTDWGLGAAFLSGTATIAAGGAPSLLSLAYSLGNTANNTNRALPAEVATTDPFKLWVSTTGRPGTAPGATQGSAVLYISTATP